MGCHQRVFGLRRAAEPLEFDGEDSETAMAASPGSQDLTETLDEGV
jgi:hypothetical protein